MKDLEIRGAGNLLGGEQSGHIAGVGFDLYVRLVGEAVADFRGEAAEDEVADVKVDLPVDAHLPHDYIPGERLRLEAYRALAAADSDEAVDAVRAELADRYGPLPEPVENLLQVARFRVFARRYGVTEVSLQGSVGALLAAVAAGVAGDADAPAVPAVGLEGLDRHDLGARGRASRGSRCGTCRCWTGPGPCSPTCSASRRRRWHVSDPSPSSTGARENLCR